MLLTVFTVNNTSDQGMGSLRQAILDSNASTAQLPNLINFALPGGPQAFAPTSPLPPITTRVTIDGTTATGYDPANPKPLIVIRGNDPMNSGGPAFSINAAGSSLRALVIDNFSGSGVVINGGTSSVLGCWIGVDVTGGAVARNTGDGILVSSPNNTIGGTTVSDRNVISGNSVGVHVVGGGATGNLVAGNFIGTDSAGLTKLGNSFSGVEVDTANNTIGGTTSVANNVISGAGNVLSGNSAGLTITGASARQNLVQGNFIGTDSSGLGSIGNIFDGIDINFSSTGNQIGGSAPPVRNVISANGRSGIQVFTAGATNNRITGNYIGVGVNGTSPLGNAQYGVFINGANNTLIGGTGLSPDFPTPELGNIIAYSGQVFRGSAGVLISGGQMNGILSNRIFSNGGLGIQLSQGNQGVQPPRIVSAQSGGSQTRIVGTYSGLANTTYRIQFFSNQIPDPSGAGEGMNFEGDLDITTNNAGIANFTTVLNQSVPVGSYLSATATQQALTNNNTSQFSEDVQVATAQVTDLSVDTRVSLTQALLNQNLVYTVTVTNSGPNAATGVVLTDTIPTNSDFVSTDQGQFDLGVVTFNIGDLASGATATVNITVKPNSTLGMLTNTATVVGDQLDPTPTNNTSTTTGSVATNADLSVRLTPDANPTPVGSPLTFSLVISNFGPSTSPIDTTATVTLPDSLSNVVVTPDQGTFTLVGNVLTLNLGVLPASTSSTVTIVGTPLQTGSITTTATVTSSLFDPNSANNSTSVAVTVANAADLALDISASPSPVLVGQEFFYTITVTNIGPSRATSPVVVDQLPAGLTFVPADSNAGGNGNVTFANGFVTATLNPLDAGAVATIRIAVIPSVSGQVVNSATVGDPDIANSAEIDPDTSNNTKSTTVLVSPADLGVVILNPADPLLIGNQAVFQVQITNNGPATATNVILTNTFGPGVTIVGSSAGQGSGGKLTANLGSLASGQSTIVSITVTTTAAGPLLDTAIVSSDQIDPDPNNNTSTSSNVVGPVDLAVSITAAPNPVLVGGQLVYVVTITNNGPTAATNVLFSDTLPGSSILNSVTSSQGVVAPASANTITGNLGTLAPGASATVVILVTTQDVSTATDTASVSSDGFDTNPANNAGSASVSVINLPGTIVVGTPLVFVGENAGFATVTFNRIGGTQGTVTVNFATTDFSAVGGINYTPTSGVITFVPGQTTATITIPILDDLRVDGNTGFFVTISNPTGGASLGTDTVAAVLVANTDRDLIPPAVIGLVAIPRGNAISGFVIFFDKAMDLARVSLTSNYHIFLSNGEPGGKGEVPVPLAAAIYTPSNNSVTLVPAAPLPANRFYHIVANGSIGLAITDVSGNLLSGFAGPGSNYDVFYGQGNKLSYRDAHSNAVSISLTGGGTMSIFRGRNGDAAALNLFGVVPHKSRLTGSVKKLNKLSSGRTTINSIVGLGQFGDVISNLTTPPFYVISAPVGYTSLAGPTQVTAASLSLPSMVAGKKTPRGPHRV